MTSKKGGTHGSWSAPVAASFHNSVSVKLDRTLSGTCSVPKGVKMRMVGFCHPSEMCPQIRFSGQWPVNTRPRKADPDPEA